VIIQLVKEQQQKSQLPHTAQQWQ